MTNDLIDFWEKLLEKYDDAVAEGKQMWFAVVHPKLNKATYYVGEPSPIGFNEAEVDAMTETTLYITPNSAPILALKPVVTDEDDAVDEGTGGYSLRV